MKGFLFQAPLPLQILAWVAIFGWGLCNMSLAVFAVIQAAKWAGLLEQGS